MSTKIDLDHHDMALLRMLPEKTFDFAKTVAQERRLFDLFQGEYVERNWRAYSMTCGGKRCSYRWAYRLTEKGKAARGEAT